MPPTTAQAMERKRLAQPTPIPIVAPGRKCGGRLKRDDGGDVTPPKGQDKANLTKRIRALDPMAGIIPSASIGKSTWVPGTPPPQSDQKASGGRLTAKQRQSLPKSDFALPGKGKGPKGAGAGSYPVPDKSHARNALARVAQHGTSAEKARVRAKVHAKYPDIKMND